MIPQVSSTISRLFDAPALRSRTHGQKVLAALQQAFDAGFRPLYPSVTQQLRLLIDLMEGNHHPDLAQVIAGQIAGVKSWSALFEDIDGLTPMLEALLKFSTASDAQLMSNDKLVPPATINLLVCLERNLLSQAARSAENKALSQLLMTHCAAVLTAAAKQAMAIARWSHEASPTDVLDRIQKSTLLGTPLTQLITGIWSLPKLDLVRMHAVCIDWIDQCVVGECSPPLRATRRSGCCSNTDQFASWWCCDRDRDCD